MKRGTIRTMAIGLGVLAAAGCGVGEASADQQQWSSQYVHWKPLGTVSSVYNIDQQVWIAKPNRSSYWPMQWDFLGSGSGGYMGLQEGDGPEIQNVRFSIWNARKAKGADCRPFGGEGIGQTCTLPVKIDPKKFYRLRLWIVSGQWWGGWLIEHDGKGGLVEHKIGEIKAPPDATSPDPKSVTNFVEYFGESVPKCKKIPLSVVGFAPPTLNYQGGGRYEATYRFRDSIKAEGNTCATGNETAGAFISAKTRDFGFAKGTMMFLGATSDKHSLSSTPTPAAMPND